MDNLISYEVHVFKEGEEGFRFLFHDEIKDVLSFVKNVMENNTEIDLRCTITKIVLGE